MFDLCGVVVDVWVVGETIYVQTTWDFLVGFGFDFDILVNVDQCFVYHLYVEFVDY